MFVDGLKTLTLGSLLTSFATLSFAQPGIYTCVDAQGRRLTSDRPIAACNDRVQKELNPSGTVKRLVQPSLTAEERAAKEETARKEMEERARKADDRKRERALLARYPNRQSHDKERAAALTQIDEVIKTADLRTADLLAQRKKLAAEIDFYKRDPSKIPLALRRQLEENDHQLAIQRRFVAGQEEEKKRVHTRFDDELDQLRRLWLLRDPGGTGK
ncbi:MAG: DUF4124 domain-containing protein [Ramlibacter sp.]|nr:DUF4124 domain-containing protein [Ramlibacter sp.]MCW5651784.1 DUF4124 domain-containing protein [Ramlibacter sp.]